jgi:ABC-type arginine/histidine transport system permease subunit
MNLSLHRHFRTFLSQTELVTCVSMNKTAYKFSKLLRGSISAVPRKAIKDALMPKVYADNIILCRG